MDRFKIVLILTLNFSIAFAQYNGNPSMVNGKISYERDYNDSIYFSNSFAIDKSYFEVPILSSKIKKERFKLEFDLSYPHMFVVSYKSERNIYPQRDGVYFIDSSTVSIIVDSIGDRSQVIGTAHQEYKNEFVPFFIKEGFKCKHSLLDCRFMGSGEIFDAVLLNYVKKYPDSYVALWFLIERIETEGFNPLYEKTLGSFSAQMKKGRLWQLTSLSLSTIQIRKNKKFPKLNLKNNMLDATELRAPKAKYTLVDFWFSRCKPCLEAFPRMKELYGRFRGKGFEIVGISVDKTDNITKWQDRIKERKLDWPQYLDENGGIAEKNKIVSYPTTFLLDEKGMVIKKNITLKNLEKLLENNLAP